jgi:hypothetical protein
VSLRRLRPLVVALTFAAAAAAGRYPAGAATNTSARAMAAQRPPRMPPPLRLVARGQYVELAASPTVSGVDLIAEWFSTGPAAADDLVRIDPRTGKVLARSSRKDLVGQMFVVDHRVWVEGGSSALPPGVKLYALDPRSLRVDLSIAIAGYNLMDEVGGLLWLEAETTCRLEGIDPATGAVVAKVQVSSPACAVVGGDASTLLLVRQPGQGMEKIDIKTDKVLRRQPEAAFDDGSSAIEADGYLWITGGALTVPTPVYIYAVSDLRLVKTLLPPLAHDAIPCDTETPFFGCPGWVELAGGVVWGGGGGDGAVGCRNPRTLAPVAVERGLDGLIGGFIDIGGRIYGLYAEPPRDQVSDVVQFRPPLACDALITTG